MTNSSQLFQKIVTPHGDPGAPPATVIFDLDSTLFDVSGRTLTILQELAAMPGFIASHGPKAALLAKIEVLSSDWGIREPLGRLGFDPDVADHLPFLREIRDFWRQHFFSSTYLNMDQPYEGAVEYVRALDTAGVEIMYLTGRDRPNMEAGTLTALEKCGFPLRDPKKQLFMKPAKTYGQDQDFKAITIHTLKTQRGTMWLLDNEPVILNKVAAEHPDIHLVYVDTVHSGKAVVPPEFLRISLPYELPSGGFT